MFYNVVEQLEERGRHGKRHSRLI